MIIFWYVQIKVKVCWFYMSIILSVKRKTAFKKWYKYKHILQPKSKSLHLEISLIYIYYSTFAVSIAYISIQFEYKIITTTT